MNYSLDDLNPAQREAVLYDQGPALIVAGAGSGKTRVITYKLAHLIEQGYDPSKLYALTFTNKAAREMRLRVLQMVHPEQAAKIRMGTFHSIFARILRSYAVLLGYTSNFTIYDTSDSKALVKNILKELGLEEKIYSSKRVLFRISSSKNNLISPEAYAANTQLREQDRIEHFGEMYKIYSLYSIRCRQNNAMDFDDLLFQFNVLLRDFPEVLQDCRNNIDYLLIDEYQDTNLSQFTLVHKLVGEHGRIFAVGDDAQSIYAFRGANIDNILDFGKIFSNAKTFRLEQNYRSTQNIVNLANGLIEKNKRRIPKKLFSLNEQGALTELNEHENAYAEADYVACQISRYHLLHGIPYVRQAILYRTNAQSRIIEDALRRAALPYVIYGGMAFYSRLEIKQVMAYLQALINPLNNEAVIRTLSFPKQGIGDKTIEKLQNLSIEHRLPLFHTIEQLVQSGNPENILSKSALGKLKSYVERMYEMANFPFSIPKEDDPKTLAGWIEFILKVSGIAQAYSSDNSAESLGRLENLRELVTGAEEFQEQLLSDLSYQQEGEPLGLKLLSAFVQSITLLTEQDTAKEEQQDSVQLMTIHAAKGLEFTNVYICGVEEMILPSAMNLDSRAIEEERRLFYVAITRAEEICHINYACLRRRNGKDELMLPSRFLSELDPQLIKRNIFHGEIGFHALFSTPRPSCQSLSTSPEVSQESLDGAPIQRSSSKKMYIDSYQKGQSVMTQKECLIMADGSSYKVGEKVLHRTFGEGTIECLFGEGDNSKASVLFVDGKTRKLLLRFAQLIKLDNLSSSQEEQ